MTTSFEQAAKVLLSNRNASANAPRLAEEIRPSSIDESLAIHQAMLAVKGPAGGWKCLRPLADGNINAAPIFADTVQSGDVVTLFADNGLARIEPEIAFVLAQDLPAKAEGYSDDEIDAAIGSCHMALELMQFRFAEDSDAEYFERLADGMVNQGLFIGPQIDKAAAYLAAEVSIDVRQGDTVQHFDGKHPNTLPQNPLYWFINFMTKRGQSFTAGEAMITGSYCGIVDVAFDCPTRIQYAGLGEYQVSFKALS
ncbi:hydratase [Neiella marina]|uniref:Hydratase n=1 Tax=Neiella holothuriorum TaxID=2870530 RepID=A0ABS7EKC2_9GAMM|nr:hydratase [Neiella holothuriorum]MBW8192127.1 hydratase [Neiella holothuriorum]